MTPQMAKASLHGRNQVELTDSTKRHAFGGALQAFDDDDDESSDASVEPQPVAPAVTNGGKASSKPLNVADSSADEDEGRDQRKQVQFAMPPGAQPAASSKAKKGGDALVAEVELEGAKRARRLTKKQELAARVSNVVVPLDELAPMIRDPNMWLTVKGSFLAAIDTKLSNWYVRSTSDDGPTNKIEKFKLDHREILETSEDVKALPIEQVCEAAVTAASALISFKDGMQSWKMPFDVNGHREKLSGLMKCYDACIADVHIYEQSVEGWAAKAEIDENALQSRARRHVKDLKTKLCGRLTNEGYTVVLSRVIDEVTKKNIFSIRVCFFYPSFSF